MPTDDTDALDVSCPTCLAQIDDACAPIASARDAAILVRDRICVIHETRVQKCAALRAAYLREQSR